MMILIKSEHLGFENGIVQYKNTCMVICLFLASLKVVDLRT